MPQLKLAYVNLKIVSPLTKPSSDGSARRSPNSSPLSAIATKAQRLHEKSPGGAAVIESLIDDLLWQFEGRKL